MKVVTTIIILSCLMAVVCSGQSSLEARLWALGELESGNNDMAVGHAGERGRWQITEKALREAELFSVGHYETSKMGYSFGPLDWQTNEWFASSALNVRIQECEYERRVVNPTDAEWCLLWHCPSHLYHPNKKELDYQRRFLNLLEAYGRYGRTKNKS